MLPNQIGSISVCLYGDCATTVWTRTTCTETKRERELLLWKMRMYVFVVIPCCWSSCIPNTIPIAAAEPMTVPCLTHINDGRTDGYTHTYIPRTFSHSSNTKLFRRLFEIKSTLIATLIRFFSDDAVCKYRDPSTYIMLDTLMFKVNYAKLHFLLSRKNHLFDWLVFCKFGVTFFYMHFVFYYKAYSLVFFNFSQI